MKQISFVIILFSLLFIKNIYFISGIILLLWIISLKDSFKLTKRVIKSIFLFNFGVTLGSLIIHHNIEYLIYINLKVFSITYFVFWFFSKNNMIQFFSFSKDLSYLLTITLSQIYSYKKTFEDFRLAYKSRVIKKLKQNENQFITKTFEFFLKKALKDSKERSLALKSRGFFD